MRTSNFLKFQIIMIAINLASAKFRPRENDRIKEGEFDNYGFGRGYFPSFRKIFDQVFNKSSNQSHDYKIENGRIIIEYYFKEIYKWTTIRRERLYRSHRIILQNACIMYVRKDWDEEEGDKEKKSEKELLFFARPLKESITSCRAVYNERIIYLAHAICLNVSVNIHENMHILGFKHEHSRPDRDEYIRIQELNIKEENLFAFQKVDDADIEYFNDYVKKFPYDFKRIVHYAKSKK
ncbi:astacin-like protein [Dinothrombium tinctorium]|uniref:Metalloendopeptidase n=1 Tax=Dinothrombium tinctorium TaxID=1965070 RepID=A0A3S3P8K3_9ACAR|nr:astacin-like protein [Dinothrombium tinctorium]